MPLDIIAALGKILNPAIAKIANVGRKFKSFPLILTFNDKNVIINKTKTNSKKYLGE